MEPRTSNFVLNVTTATPVYVPVDVTTEDGFFSMQLLTAGGTLSVDLECSNDGVNFVTPEGTTQLVTAMAAGSKFKSFDVPLCDQFRLKLTAASSTVTGNLYLRAK